MYDDFNELVEFTKECLKDSVLRKKISQKAFDTMFNEWSPRVAAKRFLLLCELLIADGKCDCFKSGPCSRA